MRKIAILCDFDGTVAQDDVGHMLFRRFSDGEKTRDIVDLWKDGVISSRECLEREAEVTEATREELDRFIIDRKIDPYFKDFFDFTKRRGIEVVIVSDGLDYYIQKMLVRCGLGEIDFYSNLLEHINHCFKVKFPYYDMKDCRDCGNCKTYHLERFRDNGYFVIYVGNGLSDRCPSEYADLVFAKGQLLDFCRGKEIECVEFRNFRDVEREVLERFVLNGDGADEEEDVIDA